MIEEHFIYFPERQFACTPADYGLTYQDVVFQTEDSLWLHGWFVPGRRDITWIWCHGNAGNISHRVDNLLLVHEILGVGVLLFDYRGYGKSDGKPSEKGTYLDAMAAWKYIESRGDIDLSKIVIFGRSLGTAIAVDLALSHHSYGVILESPITSIEEMGEKAFPHFPIRSLVRTKYDSLSKIPKLFTPLLVIHGDLDEVVPFDMGRRLFEAANEPKTFHPVLGAGHNDTYIRGGETYFEAIEAFMKGHTVP